MGYLSYTMVTKRDGNREPVPNCSIHQNCTPLSLSVPLIDTQACDVDGAKKVELKCELSIL